MDDNLDLDHYHKEINEIFKPLGVEAFVFEEDSCYYLQVDGSKVFQNDQQWLKATNRTFENFIGVFVPKRYKTMETIKESDTRLKFKIGTVFDMLLRKHDER